MSIDALTAREIRWVDDAPHEDDLAAVVGIVAADEVEVLGEVATHERQVRDHLHSPYADRAATALLFAGARAVGMVSVEHDELAHHTFLNLAAAPGDGRSEVLATGVSLGTEAAVRLRRERGGIPWEVRCGTWLPDATYHDLLGGLGFAAIRRFSQMRIDATSPLVPESAPPLPPGVEIVVVNHEEGYRAMYDVDCAAFVDHWGFVAHPYDEWCRELVDSPSRDPEGMWLLTVDGVPAGICLLDDSRLDLDDGYVGILGVLAEFRGRGLAQLLLRTAFVRDRDLGRAGTRLGVDTENSTGAVRLYEGVGMTAVLVREAWGRSL